MKDLLEPKRELTELVFQICDESTKDELLRELLDTSIKSILTRDRSELRQTLLDWEYTLLWEKYFNETKIDESK